MSFSEHTEGVDLKSSSIKVFAKDQKDFRNGLILEPVEMIVKVYCVAVSDKPEQNKPLSFALSKCIPIEGYAYNQITDHYSVKGLDAIGLGMVRMAYRLRLEGVGNWNVFVPMPEAVIKRYMTSSQRRMLAAFKSHCKTFGDELRYEYIQMLGAYPHE